MATKKTKKTTNSVKKGAVKVLSYPKKLLIPIGHFLTDQLKKLDRRKKDLEKEDPFADVSRVVDNASPDTDAAEQFGHARTKAIQEELEKKSAQIKRALKRVKQGKYGICEVCGNLIDTDRLGIYPEATVCISCEKKKEKNGSQTK